MFSLKLILSIVFAVLLVAVFAQEDIEKKKGTATTIHSTKATTPTTKMTTPTTKMTTPTTKHTTKMTTHTTKMTTQTTKMTTQTTKMTTEMTTGNTRSSNGTTTKQPMTTTQAPGPTVSPFPPETSNFFVNSSGTVCVVVKAAIRFSFTYINNKNKNSSMFYDLPANKTDFTHVSGVCGNSTQTVTASFKNNCISKFELVFTAVGGDYHVKSIKVTYSAMPKYFPNIKTQSATAMAEKTNLTFGATHKGMSFQCVSKESVDFGSPQMKAVNAQFQNVQLQAFKTDTSTNFGNASPCAADTKTDNIVPIAVGAALAGLVVIVLIAYLIGRKRSQRGYESV